MRKFEQDPIFQTLIPFVLNVEGGYSNNPNDPGGPTMHGIAYNYNVGILKNYGIYKPEDIKKLTVADAKEIYYLKYWIAGGCDRLLDTQYAYVAFDCAVNQGPGAASHFIDDRSKTFAGNGKNQTLYRALRRDLIRRRNKSYRNDKNYLTFGEGWTNRMCDVAVFAERLGVTTLKTSEYIDRLKMFNSLSEFRPSFPVEMETDELPAA